MVNFKVAYVPEHFSTPLFFANDEKYFAGKNITIEFVPVPEGTGRLIKLVSSKEVDIAIGLTEGFVADIAKGNDAYLIVDTYVKSPLCWAISSGSARDDIQKAEDLQGKAIGVSRIGSGSFIMSYVLGLQLKFTEPYFSDFKVCSNFKTLRDSVNQKTEDNSLYSDAFMWEHFTSKKYYDNGEIKRIGEIYTPWPSWVITVNREVLTTEEAAIKDFLAAVNEGIQHFLQNPDKATKWISDNLDYSEEDAQAWLKTVTFNEQLGQAPIEWERVVENTSKTLKIAGVLTDDDATIDSRLKTGILSKPL